MLSSRRETTLQGTLVTQRRWWWWWWWYGIPISSVSDAVLDFIVCCLLLAHVRSDDRQPNVIFCWNSTERCEPSYMLLKKSLLYVRKHNPHNSLIANNEYKMANFRFSKLRNWVRWRTQASLPIN